MRRFKVREMGTAVYGDGSTTTATLGDVSRLGFYTEDFSISFWAKNYLAGTRAVVAKRSSFVAPTAGYIIGLTSLGKVIVEIDDGTGEVSFSTTKGKLDKNWHHYVVTFDRDGLCSVYIDGVIDATTANISTKTNITNTRAVRFLSDSLASNKFVGVLDEVRFFNKILTQIEIDNLFYDGVVPTGLQGEYLFDEASGGVIIDTSPYGNNGTITTTWVQSRFKARSRIT